ncbi:MAG: DUF3298 and DUF4163 domain-containing protein [Firmicutes bacterium]|nr:DUF3298 and DUF4163 domain-containing protein [Bacillota bacterium]MDD4694166.1 DUF3298 and DUF4163 domain-containing protein [Bacillota bacterium]
MYKKTLLFLMILFVSLGAFASTNPLTILEGSLNYEYKKTKIDLYYPVIIEIENKDALSQINSTIKTDVFNFYEYFKQAAALIAKDVRTGLVGYVSYETTLNEPGILSINVTYYQYTGGAHGVYDVINYTFDTKTGQRLYLEDLFLPNSDYKDFIRDEVVRQITESDEMFFEDAIETVRDQNFSFYLTLDGFFVYYGLYEIWPYSNGIAEFKIPYTLLKNHFCLIRK